MKEHIRVNVSVFDSILQKLPRKQHGWDLEMELLVFLYWMACGCSYRVAGGFVGISRTTVADIVHKMLNILPEKLKSVVSFPVVSELPAIGSGFCKKANTNVFKKAVGAIDGCHVRIKCPNDRHDEYFCHKQFYSINTQAVVDSKGLFINIFVGFPGSVHDTRVLKNSPIYKNRMFPPESFYLMGDGGYPCITEPIAIVTPFRDPTCPKKKKFNHHFSKGRIVVEQAFGRLKTRWRNIFFKGLELNISNCVKTIFVAFLLHNLCEKEGDILVDHENLLDAQDYIENFENHLISSDSREGVWLRENLFEQFCIEKNL
jgi:hypothetical protein